MLAALRRITATANRFGSLAHGHPNGDAAQTRNLPNWSSNTSSLTEAVALDPRYPNAHFALALICNWLGHTERAETEFREAINLNPSFAAAHAVLGAVLNFHGLSAEAVRSVETAIRLSPNDPRLFLWLPGLAGAHYQLRHYAEAVDIGRRSWALKRNYTIGLNYVVAGLAQLGQVDEARAALAMLRGLDPDLLALRTTLHRLYKNKPGIDHFLDGLRKAGLEPASI